MALHEQSVGASDEWYTPPHVFVALGETFDVDVASPGSEIVPWVPARACITAQSLTETWNGFVWMNPPFGGRNGLVPWLDKFIAHGNGVCLVPDRTSAPWWQQWAPVMGAVLFVSPKLKFISAKGIAGKSPAQGTCLGGIGPRGVAAVTRAAATLGVLMTPQTPRPAPRP
jgi:hypothetical protein